MLNRSRRQRQQRQSLPMKKNGVRLAALLVVMLILSWSGDNTATSTTVAAFQPARRPLLTKSSRRPNPTDLSNQPASLSLSFNNDVNNESKMNQWNMASQERHDNQRNHQPKLRSAQQALLSLCVAGILSVISCTAALPPTMAHAEDEFSSFDALSAPTTTSTVTPTTSIPTSLSTTNPAETVRQTVELIKQSEGRADSTLKAYEVVADIITEGTGVGGKINYQGIQLERGYVADEDTTLYNPGLSLLTEGEKDELMHAVLEARRVGLQKASKAATTNRGGDGTTAATYWNEDAELGFQFLRQNLDPWHTVELKGYLQILPWYGAAVYLAVLAVQQFLTPPPQQDPFRTPFTIAYFVGVAAVFGPAIVLVAIGPQ